MENIVNEIMENFKFNMNGSFNDEIIRDTILELNLTNDEDEQDEEYERLFLSLLAKTRNEKHTYIIDRAMFGDDIEAFEKMSKEQIDLDHMSAPCHMARWTDEEVIKNQSVIDGYRETGILMMVTK